MIKPVYVKKHAFFKFQSFLVKEKMDKKNVQNGFSETKVGIKNMHILHLEHNELKIKILNIYL